MYYLYQKGEMIRVKCDYCESKINEEDAISYNLKEFDLTCHYCEQCNSGFSDGIISIANREILEKIKASNKVEPISICMEYKK